MNLDECNILITGGAGFIGSHLAENLVKRANKILILDDLSTGFMKNINHLLSSHNNKVVFIKGDVRSFEKCLEVTKGIDVVFHLGAQINPARAVEDPFYDLEVNARGTLNLLEASRKRNVKKFIFASTNVYGNPKYLPIDENHPIGLLSPYAASKLSGEAYCLVYNSTYNLKTVRLRFTNVYGPKQRSTKSESGVITIFIERTLKGEAPIIFGDGNQTRDFVYVDDVINAILLAGEKDGTEGEVFNIGSGVETKIKDLAKLILKLTGKYNLTPIYGPPRKADFRRCAVDVSKAKKLLGFKPRVDLVEGLMNTIKWWLSNEMKHNISTEKAD